MAKQAKEKRAAAETVERPQAKAEQTKACAILPDTTLGNDVALVAENMEQILSSPSYSLAQEDPALLQRVEMRGVRMLLELGKAELGLREDNITSTVIVFGGTQVVERTAAELALYIEPRGSNPLRARNVSSICSTNDAKL